MVQQQLERPTIQYLGLVDDLPLEQDGPSIAGDEVHQQDVDDLARGDRQGWIGDLA